MAKPRTSQSGSRGTVEVAARLLRPVQDFVHTEVAGSVFLLAGAVIALLWANSPWDEHYFDLLHSHIRLETGLLTIDKDVHAAINDGLMAIFFFLVGLEIKRELLHGELASVRRAALPVAAALGGMIVPAIIFVAINAGGDGIHGWGIPMATDIAFAMGVLAALGSRVPFSLKVFLLALAIVDDLGAIIVIAVFYTDSISLEALAWAAVILVTIVAMHRAGVRNVDAYILAGVLFWLAIFQSGIHATIAGVVLAILTPSRPYVSMADYDATNRVLTDELAEAVAAGDAERRQAILRQIESLSRDAESPLERLEHNLHGWSSFLIVPVFALANAGIPLSGDIIRDAAESEIAIGAAVGLLAGKVTGIMLASFLMVRLGAAAMPAGVTWRHLFGASLVAAIGFTVSLFITGLAYTEVEVQDEAKIGVLAASAVAGILGYLWLLATSRRQPESAADALASAGSRH